MFVTSFLYHKELVNFFYDAIHSIILALVMPFLLPPCREIKITSLVYKIRLALNNTKVFQITTAYLDMQVTNVYGSCLLFQTFKYLLVHKETTAHEVVMLSLQEFGITEPSSNFSLCEVSVSEGGFVKQRTLPDALQNLAERIGLASRYYIKSKNSSESLLPDDNVNDLVKDSVVSLLHLNPVEVSTQLMVEDFTIFRQIEATEYVDDLYELSSRYGTPSLSLFAELVNREMMWTIGEIVSENNATKRMRIIKQFIKIARQCKETQNFNSMFAIISGLGHGAVSRLKSSWEKLPSKYQR